MPKKIYFLVLIASVIFCFSCEKNDEAEPQVTQTPTETPTEKPTETPTETPSPYQADLKQLKELIISEHPQTYSFINISEFDKLYKELYNEINDSTTRYEMLVKSSKLIASIGCGHSRVDIPYFFYEDTYSNYLLPFIFFVRDGNVWVRRNYSQSSVPVGAKILSINGITIDEIQKELKSLIAADANRETGKNYKLGNRFRHYFAMNYGFFEEFQITYEMNGAQQEETVPAMNDQEIMEEFRTNYYKGPLPKYELDLDGSTAVLRIRTFTFPDGTEPFHEFIRESFKQIKDNNIYDLIIDIRGNNGGDPYCGAFLTSFLLHDEFPYFANSAYGHEDLKTPIEKQENSFEGNLYTIIDGGVFSTAGHFAALLKYHDLAIFIGEETDGSFSCNDAGEYYTLTNSEIIVRIANRIFQVDVSGMSLDEGIIPDYQINYTYEDIANQTNLEIEFAKELIGAK